MKKFEKSVDRLIELAEEKTESFSYLDGAQDTSIACSLLAIAKMMRDDRRPQFALDKTGPR